MPFHGRFAEAKQLAFELREMPAGVARIDGERARQRVVAAAAGAAELADELLGLLPAFAEADGPAVRLQLVRVGKGGGSATLLVAQ